MEHFITYYNVDSPAGAESAVLEDSIMHKGHPVTAGSRMLENFVSPIDATVALRLEAAGICILGKTKMDEFGASGLFPGADSVPSGAVCAVADGVASFALCNDYTGSVRQQAAARGLYYIHPTYGTVSRYGLIPCVLSMDQIGVVCKSPEDGRRVLSIIAGHDPKDGAMFAPAAQGTGGRIQGAGVREPGSESADCGSDYRLEASSSATLNDRSLVIGVPRNVLEAVGDTTSVASFVEGFEAVDFELLHFDVLAQVMRVLCSAELSGNISRYDGIKFGHRTERFSGLQELYTKSRTEAFGSDAKLAAIMGAMVLSHEYYERYYDKAMRIRRLIRDSLEFERYDVVIMSVPGSVSDDLRLALLSLPQLCGLPSVTVPIGSGGAVTLIADAGHEDVLFSMLRGC